MKKKLLTGIAVLSLGLSLNAQNVTVFNDVPFYSMYHYLGEGQSLPPEAYSQIPTGAIRLHGYVRDIISRKLTPEEIASIGSSVSVEVDLIAACDNYDRLAGINIALVPKGLTTYTWEQTDVKRIELGRFITPFMNKNKTPTTVPYQFKTDNLANLLHDTSITQNYDIWIEFRADGYSAAANTQVAGCADRTDVFRGNLRFVSTGSAPTNSNFFMPLLYRSNLNKYNSTDEPGTTTRTVNFTLDTPVDNAVLHLISSNHGANTNGEEYVRREHYVYLDDNLVHQYRPGGKSCEPFRVVNTQGNGIYGSTEKTLRNWLSFSNWCPGDAIPNREIKLGNLAAGQHTIKLKVPDAVFANNEGYFPISMYLQNASNGEVICNGPTNFMLSNQVNQSYDLSWTPNPSAVQSQVLYGRRGGYSTSLETYVDTDQSNLSVNNLTVYWTYENYIKSKCTDINKESLWIGPVLSQTIVLGTSETSKKDVSIYPNPSQNEVNIQSNDKIKNIELYSIDGKKLNNYQSNKIDISKLNKGVYNLNILFENGETSNQKIIKN
ncbi:peptide-N-glycosidase F-related protein [Soonwooa sp.]|uniref:peptide-N-glycosidase F-related protein n=1 Tax=Soonwooa sp. TaxID=1938592 RepID=UPI00289A80CB|nr:peptide-N-glycosidase F-related protein [Soonwooa sp.]